ncbi:MAG TPA: DUF3515 family protein [Nocardioides sp.]
MPSAVHARPVSARMRGVVALGILGLLGACSSAVELDLPDVDRETRAACTSLLEDLPTEMLGQERVEVSPEDALGRAWGDPAIVVSCGVGVPEDFDKFSLCDEVNGIGWFIPDSAIADLGDGQPGSQRNIDGTAVLTVITHAPRVRVEIPAEHRPPADVMAIVSELVVEHRFERVRRPCV